MPKQIDDQTFRTRLRRIRVAIQGLPTADKKALQRRLEMKQIQAMEVYRDAVHRGIRPQWGTPIPPATSGRPLLDYWAMLSVALSEDPRYRHRVSAPETVADGSVPVIGKAPQYFTDIENIPGWVDHAIEVIDVMIDPGESEVVGGKPDGGSPAPDDTDIWILQAMAHEDHRCLAYEEIDQTTRQIGHRVAERTIQSRMPQLLDWGLVRKVEGRKGHQITDAGAAFVPENENEQPRRKKAKPFSR